jgi:hypothetical protein
MNCRYNLCWSRFLSLTPAVALLCTAIALPAGAAWTSADGTMEVQGYLDNTTHQRFGSNAGLSKMRNRGQLEFAKTFRGEGLFPEVSFHGIFRATYDAVYDLNDDTWGDSSGGPVNMRSDGGPAIGLPSMVP